jgi:hypothetical protein
MILLVAFAGGAVAARAWLHVGLGAEDAGWDGAHGQSVGNLSFVLQAEF